MAINSGRELYHTTLHTTPPRNSNQLVFVVVKRFVLGTSRFVHVLFRRASATNG